MTVKKKKFDTDEIIMRLFALGFTLVLAGGSIEARTNRELQEQMKPKYIIKDSDKEELR